MINYVRASCLAIILTVIVDFLCAQVSSGNYETMKSRKICSFACKLGVMLEFYQNVGYFAKKPFAVKANI